VATWPTCERLLPHVLVATGHAERLEVAGVRAGWLLDRAANYLHERGQYRQAIPIAERALRVTEATLGAAHPEVAWRYDGLGATLRRLWDLAGARMQYERALAIAEASLGPDHEDVAKWRSNLGLVLHDLGDLAGARAQYERALAISEAALGPDHPTVAALRDNLSGVLQAPQDATAEGPASAL
jgi:tetratricopeptide (TPR) repeat protein